MLLLLSVAIPSVVLAAPPVAAEPGVTLPARIDAIEIHGLSMTREHVVLRELPWRRGTMVTQDQFDLGITRLWNTSMFSRVAGRIVRRGDTNVAVFDLEERFPIRPILEFQTGGNAHWIDLGASYRNILGRYLEGEIYLQDFDGQWGGSAWFRDPRFFGRRLELVAFAERVMRSRPDYVVRTSRAHLELDDLVMRDLVRFGTSLEMRKDDLLPPLQGSAFVFPDEVDAAIAEASFRIGRIDTIRLREEGFSLEARPAVGVTDVPGYPAFRRLWFDANARFLAGDRWNLDLRAQFGTVTDHPDELQFFIGGLDLLRGYPDNYFQADACAIYNADVKFVLFDSTWLAVLPEAFSDGAVIRRAIGTRDAAFSVGGGVVFVIPKLVDSLLRVDLGVPLRPPYTPGLSTGTQVFF